jgi:hypothetical protein
MGSPVKECGREWRERGKVTTSLMQAVDERRMKKDVGNGELKEDESLRGGREERVEGLAGKVNFAKSR